MTNNGAAAIGAATTFAARLFLLDLALPDMDGFELVRRLRGIDALHSGTATGSSNIGSGTL